MPTVLFPHDNNCSIEVPDGWYSYDYSTRPHKEPLFRDIITYLIRKGLIQNNIIEGGAFIGDNALPWAKNIPGTVYAIDPSPGNCQYMRYLANMNSINNVTIIENALGDKVEELSTSDDLYMCSFKKNEGSSKVMSTSLDILLANRIIDSIGFIHFDIEGFEYKAIKGAECLISTFKPIIAYEQHLTTDDYLGLAEHLKQRGYTVYIINEILEGCNPDCRNMIAVPNTIDMSDLYKHLIPIGG